MTTETKTVPVVFWPNTVDGDDGLRADLEVVRDEYEPGKIAIHTYVNGEGSKTSYYLDREAAIIFARDILAAVAMG